jgi:hypothetical protein
MSEIITYDPKGQLETAAEASGSTAVALPEIIGELDTSNPYSLASLLPPPIRRRVPEIPTEFYELSEDAMAEELFGSINKIDPLLNRLRIALWDEYDRCQKHQLKQMDMLRLYRGICTTSQFYKVLNDPKALGFYLTPPTAYTLACKELLTLTVRKMREAINMPLYDKKGNPNTKLIEAIIKIHEKMDMRIHGAVIQRIDQRNLNMNINASADPNTEKEANRAAIPSLEAINDEIARLEAKSMALSAPSIRAPEILPTNPKPEVIDVGKNEG